MSHSTCFSGGQGLTRGWRIIHLWSLQTRGVLEDRVIRGCGLGRKYGIPWLYCLQGIVKIEFL